MPVDEHGNWYREQEEAKEASEGTNQGEARGEEGLSDAERAILADLDQA